MIVVLVSQVFLGVMPTALGGDPLGDLARLVRRVSNRPVPPKTDQDKIVEQLARNIDWLEREIDTWGTVTAKSPDIWGEARLVKYRREFEEVLARELDKFPEYSSSYQGGQYVQDNAFLATALSINSRALDGEGAPLPDNQVQAVIPVNVGVETGADPAQQSAAGTGQVDVNIGGRASSVFGLADENNGVELAKEFTLEPTLVLDQLARYVNHLHEIRRTSEGDDIADSPGYSANLIRIPISILPGKKTKDGFGAELTVTAEPYYGPELLPVAFRDLVINDLVDQLALPLTRFLNGQPGEVDKLMQDFQVYLSDPQNYQVNLYNSLLDELKPLPAGTNCEGTYICTLEIGERYFVCQTGNRLLSESDIGVLERDVRRANAVRKAVSQINSMLASGRPTNTTPFTSQDTTASVTEAKSFEVTGNRIVQLCQSLPGGAIKEDLLQLGLRPSAGTYGAQGVNQEEPLAPPVDDLVKDLLCSQRSLNDALEKIQKNSPEPAEFARKLQLVGQFSVVVPNAGRRSTLPFPPSQQVEVFGLPVLGHLANQAYQNFKYDVLNRHVVHVSDVQALLREELSAAYGALETEQAFPIWHQGVDQGPQIVNAVRMGDDGQLKALRDHFFVNLWQNPHPRTVGNALTWCILVESVLLNQRLNSDIRETLGTRPGYVCPAEGLVFFGPAPHDDARQLFAEYAKIRWPIHIFTVDPANSEQNIVDISSVYRQMQLAVALNFASGQTGVGAALQAMRQLQRDRATVDINRTVVGFSHGPDTFGWRFYPRFQTPPVQGNFRAFVRDMVVGGPTDRQLERAEEIEPGIRECMAIVVMPSFIPHVTFQTHSNWFGLANPQRSGAGMAETVHFSRVIQHSKKLAQQCVCLPDAYRNGEIDRLLAKVQQLDRELPSQTLQSQIPIENHLGGFELFSTGTRELAPELLGWYGAPGYDTQQGCTLFLSGDNFSVHQTRLIAGNRPIDFRMLSKQIIEVNLPPGLPFIDDPRLLMKTGRYKSGDTNNLMDSDIFRDDYEGYIDAHVATPYGVSGHLLIPVVRRSAGSELFRPILVNNQVQIQYELNDAGTSVQSFSYQPAITSWLRIQIPSGLGLEEREKLTLRLYESDRLVAELAEIDMVASPDGKLLVVPRDNLATAISTNGAIGTALKSYVEFSRAMTGTERLSFTATASLGVVRCVGQVEITAEIAPES
ncbi:MAG: hypothetical protein Aurels2KO_50830 [Aureliella sp.]